MSNPGSVRRADQPEDYLRFGVAKDAIEAWEDGKREDQRPGTFEWWYYEVRMADMAIVVSFLTKPLTEPQGDLKPLVSVKVRALNGDSWGGELGFPKSAFDAGTAACSVRMGRNACHDLGGGKYRVEFDIGDVAGTLMIDRGAHVPAARIGTGHLLFDRDGSEQYFGWLVPIPYGVAQVDMRLGDTRVQGPGSAYHDHNWGNGPMPAGIHHWYWGRAEINGYVLIAANTTAQAAYGGADHTDLILIDPAGSFIARGNQGTSFTATDPSVDPVTKKPVAKLTTYTFVDGGTTYTARFAWGGTIVAQPLGGAAYHRFVGAISLEISQGGNTSPLGLVKGIWELMWFGDAPSASGLDLYTRMLSEPTTY